MQHADRDTRWMLAGGAVLAIAVVCGSLALAGVRLDDRDAAVPAASAGERARQGLAEKVARLRASASALQTAHPEVPSTRRSPTAPRPIPRPWAACGGRGRAGRLRAAPIRRSPRRPPSASRGEPGGAAPGRVGLGAGRLLEGPRGGPGLLRLDRPGIAPDGDRRVSRARRTGLLRNGRSRRGRVQRRERRLGARGGGRAPVASNGRGPTGAGAAQPADGSDRIGGQAPVVDAGGRAPTAAPAGRSAALSGGATLTGRALSALTAQLLLASSKADASGREAVVAYACSLYLTPAERASAGALPGSG